MDSFLSEVALTDVKTLDELNRLLKLWIDDHYHKTPHHGLGGITPEVAFKADKRSLKFIDMRTLTEAFLHSEERTVDKTGCISFEGKRYEVGLQLIGRKVEVHMIRLGPMKSKSTIRILSHSWQKNKRLVNTAVPGQNFLNA